MERKIYKLDDSVLAQIVRLVQLGFATNSDVTDHMRQLRLEESVSQNGNLVLTPEYIKYDKSVIEKLLDGAELLQAQQEAKN